MDDDKRAAFIALAVESAFKALQHHELMSPIEAAETAAETAFDNALQSEKARRARRRRPA